MKKLKIEQAKVATLWSTLADVQTSLYKVQETNDRVRSTLEVVRQLESDQLEIGKT